MNTQTLAALSKLAEVQKSKTEVVRPASTTPKIPSPVKIPITIDGVPTFITPEEPKNASELAFEKYKSQIDELSVKLEIPLTDLLFRAIDLFHKRMCSPES